MGLSSVDWLNTTINIPFFSSYVKPVLIPMKIYFNVIYKDGKGTVTSSVESLMLDHFSQVASIYSQIRTIDYEQSTTSQKNLLPCPTLMLLTSDAVMEDIR